MNSVLKMYWQKLSSEEKERFAKAVGTTVRYITVSLYREQVFKAEMCSAIELESAGSVTRKDLRPNDWPLIWPELVVLDKAC